MVRILVTAIGGGGQGDQILKALRLAREKRYKIFWTDANGDCPQSKFVEEFVRLPFASDKEYLPRLLDTCRQLKVDALFHGSEQELRVFANNREAIEREGIFLPINSTSLIEKCMDKEQSSLMLRETGHNVPKFKVIKSNEDIDTVDFFPVIVKPRTGGRGSSNVFIAQDVDQLRGLALYVGLNRLSKGFLIQEYVGTAEEEFTVGVMHGLDGSFMSSIALRRHLRSGLSVRESVPNETSMKELGPSLVISSGVSQGDIGEFGEITQQCRELADRLKSKGPLNFQCRVVNGNIRVFEINPRFSGTTSLRAMVGLNEPDLMIRKHILGEDIKGRIQYRNATILRTLVETELEPALQ